MNAGCKHFEYIGSPNRLFPGVYSSILLENESFNITIVLSVPPKLELVITPNSSGLTFSPNRFTLRNTSQEAHFLVKAGTSGFHNVTYNLSGADSMNYTSLSRETVTILAHRRVPDVADPTWGGMELFYDAFPSSKLLRFAKGYQYNTTIWKRISHGFPSTACGAHRAKALYFTHLGTRDAMTSRFDVVGYAAMLHFYFRYGTERRQSYDTLGDNLISCEAPEIGEEVTVSFSTDTRHWQLLKTIPLKVRPSNVSLFHVVLCYVNHMLSIAIQ